MLGYKAALRHVESKCGINVNINNSVSSNLKTFLTMATATQVQVQLQTSLSSLTIQGTGTNYNQEDVAHLADLCRASLNSLALNLPTVNPSHPYTADEILALPLAKHRIPDVLHDLPRRKSARHEQALAVAVRLDPAHEGSLTAMIRYEADRVRLRGWAALQRKFDVLTATRRNGHATMGMSGGVPAGVRSPVWSSRIATQGPWDPARTPVSLDGCVAIPMPVQVAEGDELAPFFAHLAAGGTHVLAPDQAGGGGGFELDGGKGEPYYGVKGAEFRKGVVYEDGRMDLCKMVVGPDHIWRLMDSLRANRFVRHFLLGNNIIGPSGARAIAEFVAELPDRMDTWYLAGNCISATGLRVLVDALVRSPAVTSVWLKRNPLGADAAHDVFRLITGAPNLHTLDVDQTELGDRGVAQLFTELAAYRPPVEGAKLPLRNIYLNGNGISHGAGAAIASFLRSPHCGLSSIYMSLNPLGNDGACVLAEALPSAPQLTRLIVQSVGVSTQGAAALCSALSGHAGIRTFDLGQAYATEDLGQAYNYVDAGAVPSIVSLIESAPGLEYYNLGYCPISPPTLREISAAVLRAPSLLYYAASSVLADPEKASATFTPSRSLTLPNLGQRSPAEVKSDQAVRAHLEKNVKAKYGEGVTYTNFMEEEKRWLVNDKVVRKIDSVYRNRDAGLARRRLMTLVKDWEENDTTLEEVMNVQGPVCSLRRR